MCSSDLTRNGSPHASGAVATPADATPGRSEHLSAEDVQRQDRRDQPGVHDRDEAPPAVRELHVVRRLEDAVKQHPGGEQRRWLVHDVGLPLAGAVAAAAVVDRLMPRGTGVVQLLLILGIAALATIAATAALAPDIRSFVLPYLRRSATPEVV